MLKHLVNLPPNPVILGVTERDSIRRRHLARSRCQLFQQQRAFDIRRPQNPAKVAGPGTKPSLLPRTCAGQSYSVGKSARLPKSAVVRFRETLITHHRANLTRRDMSSQPLLVQLFVLDGKGKVTRIWSLEQLAP